MSLRKRGYSSMSNKAYKKKHRPHVNIKLEDVPPVNSLTELISLGRSIKYYKGINTLMLWKITPYLEELNKLVGMKSLKETVFFQVIYYLQGMHTQNQNDEYLHTLILGSPGTGKTTVAEIIGKIYQAMGILSGTGIFKIAHRDDFIAEYLGQTAIKTRKLLKSCLGGVLFIEEAYSLAPKRSDKDSFAGEALDTLNAFLSEHKNDFCCIAAGYEEDVRNRLFAMNRGLERRFTWVHKIDNYSSEELSEIFFKKVNEMKWHINITKEEILSVIEQNKELFKNAGGDVETFLGKCKMIHAKRVFSLPKEHRFVLTLTDVSNTVAYIKTYIHQQEDNKHLSMYM